MKIILFNNSKGLISGEDPQIIECERSGVLRIGNEEIKITSGEHSIMPLLFEGRTGDYGATFTTPTRRVWDLGNVTVREGQIHPHALNEEELIALQNVVNGSPAEDEKKTKYRLCDNGRGVLMTREPVLIEGELKLELEGVIDGYTAVIRSGESVFYRPVKDGSCEIDASKLASGAVQISLAKDDEVKPTWTLDELYSVCAGNVAVVSGNTLEYDRLLSEQRVEMDALRADMLLFKAELEQFRKDFDAVYKGYEII